MKEWLQYVLSPLLKGDIPDAKDIERLGGLALFSADTDKIKEYVFESSRLPEIRGASIMLDDLNQGWPDDQSENIRTLFTLRGLPVGERDNPKAASCIIYAGGGSLLALVPLEIASILKQEIEALYPRITGIATITCVYQQVSAEDIQEHLDKTIACQVLLLRQAKEEKGAFPFFEAPPPVRRCESCGIRPATHHERAPEPRWLCDPCKRKLDMGRNEKTRWTRSFVQELKEGSLNGRLKQYLGGKEPSLGVVDEVKMAQDLDEIALAAKDGRSIAFIYADGNRVGSWVESSKNLRDFRNKSDKLRRTMRESVFFALASNLQIKRISRQDPDEEVDIHPFEIITIGGDEALLVVPADKALDVALALGQTFEKKPAGNESIPWKLTLSVGLVIADSHNPVHFLFSLAESLLKNAKRRVLELSSNGDSSAEGTIDFITLKTETMLPATLTHLRTHFPWTITCEWPREKDSLTGRPFTWTEAERLKQTAQAVARGLPRAQIQALRQELRRGRLVSTMSYLYQFARASDEQRGILRWVEMKWGVRANSVPPPWIKLQRKKNFEHYQTVWEDIFEAQEMISPLDDARWDKLKSKIQRDIGG